MRALGGLCLEGSLGTWEHDPFLHDFFFWSELTCSVSQKVDTEPGQPPTPQARPQDTDHLSPSNLGARTLSLVEHTLFKCGGDFVSCEAKIRGSGEVLCAKSTFFSLLLKQNESSQNLVWVSTPRRGKQFCFLFSDPIIVGFRENYIRPFSPGK